MRASFLKLGGKGAALARLRDAGFQVPPFFAVPPDAALDADQLRDLGGDEFAVRSSGAAEDGGADSFAGQFDTFLHVASGDVAAKIEAVRLSARGEAVRTYCRERGVPPPETPTVLVQRMIRPRAAGVAFSADPVSGARKMAVVSAVEGTGEKLVSGEVDGQTWRWPLEEEAAGDLLTPVEVRAVAELAWRCEVFFERPQDIEWALDGEGTLWLLQSRPITTLALTPDPRDPIRVWDNSNIAESYGGVTTPLTFSFARRIYEHVYREFCALMSVPAARVRRADEVFPQMLGLIRGRVYYNLGSWYRVLALLPGFQINRSFMEQMMGVREPLPAELVDEIVAENRAGKFADTVALLKTCGGLIRRLFGLNRSVQKFQARLDAALAPIDPTRMSGEELVGNYRSLERQLLKKWDAPLVNDFFAMIFYGVLRALCRKWAGDETGSLQNELLADSGGIISAEPARRIREMAALKRAGDPAFQAALDAYLDKFGDRCLEELKLESPTLRDNASTLLAAIDALAAAPPTPELDPVPPAPVPRIGNPLKRFLFHRVLNQTRERVRCRENLRFERTRLFGRVRSLLRELGRRLFADGRLEAPEDVFHLELSEILAVWEGAETTAGLADLARLRRVEFDAYRADVAPPDRFTTRGPTYRYESWPPEVAPIFEGDIKGVGACPGIVRGRVRVVLEPKGAILEPGEILVALQTDPGWVVLFPAASGLLVERGSLLSHSAIVSRELRLPCIVSLRGITSRLKTGDFVEMDGSTGAVRILES